MQWCQRSQSQIDPDQPAYYLYRTTGKFSRQCQSWIRASVDSDVGSGYAPPMEATVASESKESVGLVVESSVAGLHRAIAKLNVVMITASMRKKPR